MDRLGARSDYLLVDSGGSEFRNAASTIEKYQLWSRVFIVKKQAEEKKVTKIYSFQK